MELQLRARSASSCSSSSTPSATMSSPSRPSQSDDRLDDGERPPPGQHLDDEAPIDLDRVDSGIGRGSSATRSLCRSHPGRCGRRSRGMASRVSPTASGRDRKTPSVISICRPAGIQARGGQDREQPGKVSRIAELLARRVDAHPQRQPGMQVRPAAHVGACLAQDPGPDLPDEADLLGQRDEGAGPNEPAIRVLPAGRALPCR